MAKYKFQFKTGYIFDGHTELKVNDHIAEVEGEVSESLASTIEAHGGQLVTEKPKPKSKPKTKRKAGVK